MPLYQKYRPTHLSDIVGNKPVVEALESVLSSKEIPHAFLLTGPSGTGKTTIARIIARHLNVGSFDFIEIDSADFRGIDMVRDIRKQLHQSPLSGKHRLWLIDECHQLTKDAQNALLKGLEDTPPHAYIVLCTTEPQKILKTIHTRCMTFNMQSLPESRLAKLIQDVTAKEGKTVSDDIVKLIAIESLGSPRAALVALEKVIDLEPRFQAKAVDKALAAENQVIELCRALFQREKWNKVATILSGLQEQDPESIRRAVLGYFSAVLLKGTIEQNKYTAYLILDTFKTPTYDIGWPGIVMMCFEASGEGKKE